MTCLISCFERKRWSLSLNSHEKDDRKEVAVHHDSVMEEDKAGLRTQSTREEVEALDVRTYCAEGGCRAHLVHHNGSGATEVAFDGNAKEVVVVRGNDHAGLHQQGLHRSSVEDGEAEGMIRLARAKVGVLGRAVEEGEGMVRLSLDDKEGSHHRSLKSILFFLSWSWGTVWEGSFWNLLRGLQIHRPVWKSHRPQTYHHESLPQERPSSRKTRNCFDCYLLLLCRDAILTHPW